MGQQKSICNELLQTQPQEGLLAGNFLTGTLTGTQLLLETEEGHRVKATFRQIDIFLEASGSGRGVIPVVSYAQLETNAACSGNSQPLRGSQPRARARANPFRKPVFEGSGRFVMSANFAIGV